MMKDFLRDRKNTALGFSLVEMLMALLIASLLMTALAPVMTRKFEETISVNGTSYNEKRHEINYLDENCQTVETKEGYSICKGSFTVPIGFNGELLVTAIGGGGGGGAAITSGTIEYTTDGTYNFTVPAGVTELEVTIAGGGAGGNAGGYTLNENSFKWTTGGIYNLNGNDIPEIIKNKNVLVTACGAGGGGGGGAYAESAGGGGAGGYYLNKVLKFPNISSLSIRIGGAGGRGINDNYNNIAPAEAKGGNWGGGAGGTGGYEEEYIAHADSQTQVENGVTVYYGSGGYAPDDRYGTGGQGAVGGGSNGQSISNTFESGTIVSGGAGAGGGGNGGNSFNRSLGGYGSGGGGGGSRYAGGGGGGATANGGGGGGGPTWIDGSGISTNFFASGGGGGGGGGYYDFNPSGGGGGGGGTEGGAGGNGKDNTNTDIKGYPGFGGGPNRFDGTGHKGGISGYMNGETKMATIFGDNNCNGGDQNKAGKPGAMRISYLDYSKGGLGGASGEWKVKEKVKVRAGDKLTIKVGSGGKGGSPAYINDLGTRIDTGAADNSNTQSFIKDSSGNTLISTAAISDTTLYSTANTNGTNGSRNSNASTICSAGEGGTNTNKTGKNATGYGGCGGGGGYSLNSGGNGAAGYVKITWNPDKKGTGSGGGSANTVKREAITVKSNMKFEYEIASGGTGGSFTSAANNTLEKNLDKTVYTNGTYGGETVFATNISSKKITAGGGYGGISAYVTGSINDRNSYVLHNGTGGAKADICKIDNTLLICTGTFKGGDGENTKGGNGADSSEGSGGGGSSAGNGAHATGSGAGGGGAGVNICTQPSNCTPFSGGKGAPGKIILEWRE